MRLAQMMCASALALSAANQAYAQQQPSPAAGASAEVDEVVITARKREEQIIDVPASVSSFSGEQIEELGGVTDIKDLSYVAPGLAFVDTGNINAEVNIRGAGAGTARVTGVDAPIGVLRNGVSVSGGNIGGRTYTRTDLFDVERVEVVRGPQGALYGVNSVGGVMNVISRRPEGEFGFRVSGSWTGETQRSAAEGILNIPITDSLAVRIGAQYADAEGGHFINRFSGNPGDIEEYSAFRFSALWEPTEKLSAYFVYDNSSDVSPSNRIKTVYALNDPTATPGPIDPDGPFRYGQNTPNRADRDLTTYTAQIDWSTWLGDLTSITSYRERDTRFLQDEDGSAPGYAQAAFPAASCFTRSCVSIFTDYTEMSSQEFRLTNSIGDDIDWMIGVNFQYRETEFAFISDGRTNNNVATLSATANSASVSIDEDRQAGIFSSLTWRATDRLTIDGAMRWGRSEKAGNAYNVRRGAGPVFCPYLDPIHGDLSVLPTCITLPISFDETYENVSPSIAAKFAVTEQFNLFATLARGYRSGGFNGTAVSFPGTVPESYDPEETTAYEAGAKFKLGGGLVTVSAFKNEFDGLLVSLPIPGDLVGRSYRDNAGKAETHGIDLEWAGKAAFFPEELGRLELTGAVNWLDGEIQDGPYKGRTVEGSPEYTYTATAIYTKRIRDGWRFSASASYRGQRGGFTNTTQINNLVPLDDLDLWDARVAVDVGNLQVALSAENLFDETYVALKDPNRSVYGDPREITLKLTYRFGSEAPSRR